MDLSRETGGVETVTTQTGASGVHMQPTPDREPHDDPRSEYHRLFKIEEQRMAEEREERERNQQFRQHTATMMASIDTRLGDVCGALRELVELMRPASGVQRRGCRGRARVRGGRR